MGGNGSKEKDDMTLRFKVEQARCAGLQSRLQAAQKAHEELLWKCQLAAGLGIVAFCAAGGAAVVLARRRVAVAQLATERLCATRYEAELADVRRRASIDLENKEKFAVEKFARDLLPVADSLQLASQHSASSSEGAAVPSSADVAGTAAHADALFLPS
eukprot:TRINITY_DN27489_c0_g1_i5.p1 TRINITY_DN27489_c0_g1~~TRINITY_DN27489_c0_g1_i5.p1  ORF type:complete len:159 (+),score=38.41 TRINITY_DN27489_c0_g1_i5:74-550(+)